MKKQHIQRIAGYALWVGGLLLLPRTLLNLEGRVPNAQTFFLFTVMVALLLVGFVLIDSANDALAQMHRHPDKHG